MDKRIPVAAGSFYSAKPDMLNRQIEQAFTFFEDSDSSLKISNNLKGKIKALICPHAGYMYSGPIAACAYKELAKDHSPKQFLLIGPNHTGFGAGLSLYPEGLWETPLGTVRVDNSWLSKPLEQLLEINKEAHLREHSLEVQIPFLQYIFKNNFTISALTIKDQSLKTTINLANAINSSNFPFIVASSDLSHYESAKKAKYKDSLIIETFINKDAEKMYEEILENDISACGYGPIALVCYLSKINNWKNKILCYKTSGDIIGDNSAVVGYMAGLAKED